MPSCLHGTPIWLLTNWNDQVFFVLACHRPAVVASYAVSSLSAVASALCYAEYAVDFPIAGGGYGFVSLTYGEFIGW